MKQAIKRLGAVVLSDRKLRAVMILAVFTSFLLRLLHNRAFTSDNDDGVYWQTAIAIGSGHQAYAEVFHAQPPLFAWLLSGPFHAERYLAALGMQLSSAEFFGRLGMIGFATLLVAAAAGIASTLKSPLVGLLAGLIAACLPLLQLFSYQFGADLPAAALTAVSVHFALRARISKGSWRYWIAAGAALALAALVKFIAVVAVPCIAVALLTPMLASPRWWPWLRRTTAAVACASLGFAVAAVAMLLSLKPPTEAWRQVIDFHVQASAAAPDREAVGLITSMGPWMIAFFVAAILAANTVVVANLFRRDRTTGRLGGSVSLALWTIAVIPFAFYYKPVFVHHLILFVAPGAAMIAIAIGKLAGVLRVRWRPLAALVIVAASVFCVWQAGHTTVGGELRSANIEACLKNMPRDWEVATDDQEVVARAGLRTPPWLVDTSYVRINTGYLSDDEVIAMADQSDAFLFSRIKRLGDRPRILAWAKERFPVRYSVNGYLLRVKAPEVLSGCSGGKIGIYSPKPVVPMTPVPPADLGN